MAEREVLAEIVDELESFVDPSNVADASRLESFGWWCIFGANVAHRSAIEEAERSQLMGLFTNKADEIAERIGNWALRERVWALELSRRSAAGEQLDAEWVVDLEDLRQISGAMARFPQFRADGWRMLRAIKIREIEGNRP